MPEINPNQIIKTRIKHLNKLIEEKQQSIQEIFENKRPEDQISESEKQRWAKEELELRALKNEKWGCIFPQGGTCGEDKSNGPEKGE